jgi:hypothetical protein
MVCACDVGSSQFLDDFVIVMSGGIVHMDEEREFPRSFQ